MTVFEVGAFCGIAGGAVTGGVLCKAHGVLAIIGGVIGGAVTGLFGGLLFAFLVMLVGGLYYIITGRLRPDGTIKEKKGDP